MKVTIKSLRAFFAALLFVASTSQAAVITLQSGAGVTPGTVATPVLDPNVKVLQGPAVGDFAALTPVQFAAAQAGPAAFVVAPHPQWITPAASLTPTAQWVSVTANGSLNLAGNPAGSFTGLYAISFNLAAPVTSAVLNLTAYADNVLGSATNAGIYLNGVALANSNGVGSTGYNAAGVMSLTNVNVLPLLVVGVNTLYFDVVNTLTGPSGLMFSATITTPNAPVPAPGVLLLLAFGMLILLAMRRHSKVGV